MARTQAHRCMARDCIAYQSRFDCSSLGNNSMMLFWGHTIEWGGGWWWGFGWRDAVKAELGWVAQGRAEWERVGQSEVGQDREMQGETVWGRMGKGLVRRGNRKTERRVRKGGTLWGRVGGCPRSHLLFWMCWWRSLKLRIISKTWFVRPTRKSYLQSIAAL